MGLVHFGGEELRSETLNLFASGSGSLEALLCGRARDLLPFRSPPARPVVATCRWGSCIAIQLALPSSPGYSLSVGGWLTCNCRG
jgi:hypothetical protein